MCIIVIEKVNEKVWGYQPLFPCPAGVVWFVAVHEGVLLPLLLPPCPCVIHFVFPPDSEDSDANVKLITLLANI